MTAKKTGYYGVELYKNCIKTNERNRKTLSGSYLTEEERNIDRDYQQEEEEVKEKEYELN